jgi:Asp/Glu/hydantoin racemase
MMARVGLVHTVPALGAVFHDLVLDAAATVDAPVEPIHVTDPWLLQTAISAGVTPDVVNRLDAHVMHLRGQGVEAVLVTCSSLGEATEVIPASGSGLPVVRIDQAMADRAVELAGAGGKIAVLTTVESTVGPTVRLLRRSAEQAGAEVRIETETLAAAGEARAAGDNGRHDHIVVQAVQRWAVPERADVVVLAQASMAHLADTIAESARVAVVSSPRLAVGRLLAQLPA